MWSLNKSYCRFIILPQLLLLLLANATFSQSLFFSKNDLFDAKSGIKIDHLVIDPQGFLWAGANRGLFMSDGITEIQYLPEGNESAEVGALTINDSLLYLGWKDGSFSIFDLYRKSFKSNYKISNSAINKIVVDNKGRIWLATEGEGIYVEYSTKVKRITTNFNLADDHVNDLILDPKGDRVWAATDRGLSKCSIDEDSLLVQNYTTIQGLPENLVTSLAFDSLGTLWIGSYSGYLTAFNLKTESFKTLQAPKSWSPGIITCLKTIDDELWIGTGNNGIGIYNFERKDFLVASGAEINDAVHDIIYDGTGMVFLSTGTASILKTDKRFLFIKKFDEVSLKDAGVVCYDNNGNILFSNETGLYSLSPPINEGNPVKRLMDLKTLNIQYIISLYIDNLNRIWIGTFGQGLWLLDGKKLIQLTEKDGLINDNILSISGRKDEIWIGTLGGISMLNFNNKGAVFNNFGTESGLKSNYVYSVYAKENNVWFGTDGSGLIKYENGLFKTVVDTGIFATVYSVTGSGDEIWFSGRNGSLNQLIGDAIINYQIKYNEVETEISTLATIDDEHIFFLSENGVGMFDKETHQYIIFDEEYGLKPFNYNFLNILSSSDDKENIWIGTEAFMLEMQLHEHEFIFVPKTHIRTVELFSNPIDTNRHIFDPGENHFIFSYSGLWVHAPEKVRFKYRLKGFDVDWKETRDNGAIYQKLPPGTYTFEVSSSTSSNFDSVPSAFWTFTIKKPVYFQWWFIVTAMLVSWLLVYLIIKWYDRKKIKDAQIAREKILSQFELLKSQVNPHFLFNSLNTVNALIYKEPKEASEYLLKLSDFLRVMLTRNDNVTHSLGEELKLAHQYGFLQKKRFGDNLIIEIEIPDELLNKVLIPPLTLQILLENAIKHNVVSRSNPLTIHIFKENEYLVVKNNLQEIKEKIKSTGIGLSNISNRYRIIFGKEIGIKKDDDYFIVKLPLMFSNHENTDY